MHLVRVQLTDFRSYARADVAFGPGCSILLGANGMGKTNVVEAVIRAATGGSHRVAGDGPLVRVGADQALVQIEARTDHGRRRTLDVQLGGSRPRTRVDGNDVKRSSDALGVVRIVVFAPEDLAIVRGTPSERRRYLDDLLGQRRPAYGAARAEYEKVLRQRNHLLKQLRGGQGRGAGDTLEDWDEQLVRHAATLTAARIAAVHALAGPVDRAYRQLADRPEQVELTYRLSWQEGIVGTETSGVPDLAELHDKLTEQVRLHADEERRRGVTLVGPHRDDLELMIGPLPARTHASQGEAWSLALALKLGTHDVLHQVGDRPVVVLDDVFSELDATRRARLAAQAETFDQVIVTAAVPSDVPLRGVRYEVTLVDAVSTIRRVDGDHHAAEGVADA